MVSSARWDKNPPTNTGGHGFNPWSEKISQGTGQLSLYTTTTEEARTPQQSPLTTTRKSLHVAKTQRNQKIKKKKDINATCHILY